MISLNLEPPARLNHERVNIVEVLAVLDEINGVDGYDPQVVCEQILPRLADDLRAALARKTCLSTHLEQRLDAKDREIRRLEEKLAESAVERDFERTVFEKFLHALQQLLIELPISDAWRVVNALVEENLLRF